MLIYGGYVERRQISKVVGCSLKRIGSLPFDHNGGACAAGGGFIYLCFSDFHAHFKDCRRSKHPVYTFGRITNSNYGHRSIRLAASNGEVIMILEFLDFN